MKKQNRGFTLVEIMIVVVIMGVLAAVAIPNFVKYRRNSRASACISNLKQIQSAIEQCKLAGRETTAANLYGVRGYLQVEPRCPSQPSVAYNLPSDDTSEPTCTYTGTDASDTASWHKLNRGTPSQE